MAYTVVGFSNTKESQYAEADLRLQETITATDGGASAIIDTEGITPALGRVLNICVQAGEDITVADTDTLKIDILTASDSTGDTRTLFSETYTESGGGSSWSEGDHIFGVSASNTADFTFFTDFTFPVAGTQRYIKITLTAGASDGTDDKDYIVTLCGSNLHTR